MARFLSHDVKPGARAARHACAFIARLRDR